MIGWTAESILELVRDLRCEGAADDIERRASVAEALVSADVVLPLLLGIQSIPRDPDDGFAPILKSTSKDACDVADACLLLLSEMYECAKDRLRKHGWRVCGAGKERGGYEWEHENGERSEDPKIPGMQESNWQASVLLSLPMLFTPGRGTDGKIVWPVTVLQRDCVGCSCGGRLPSIRGDPPRCNCSSHISVCDVLEEDLGLACNEEENQEGPSVVRKLVTGVWRGVHDDGSQVEALATLSPGTTLETFRDTTALGLVLLGLQSSCVRRNIEKRRVLLAGGASNICVAASFLSHRNARLECVVAVDDVRLVHAAENFFGVHYKRRTMEGTNVSHFRTHSHRPPSLICSGRKDTSRIRSSKRRLRASPDAEVCVTDLITFAKDALRSKQTFHAIVVDLSSTPRSFDGKLLQLLGSLLDRSSPLMILCIGRGVEATFRRSVVERVFGTESVRAFQEDRLRDEDKSAIGDEETVLAVSMMSSHPPLPALSVSGWQRCIQGIDSEMELMPVSVSLAQRTPVVVRRGFLSDMEIKWVHEAALEARRRGAGVEIRRRGSDVSNSSSSATFSTAWSVLFLQTHGLMDTLLPWLRPRLVSLAREVDQKRWNDSILRGAVTSDADESALNVRCCEYHTNGVGNGLPDEKHYDEDSLITVDIMLSRPGVDFTGGVLQSLETSGELKSVSPFEQGDAAVFISHKYHCVSPVTRGERQVLVTELWSRPNRTCPHRCETLQRRCRLESISGATSGDAEELVSIPFRLGSVSTSTNCERLLWQRNTGAVELKDAVEMAIAKAKRDRNVVPSMWDAFDGDSSSTSSSEGDEDSECRGA